MLFPRLHPELELCHDVPVPGRRSTQTSARQGVPKPSPPAQMAPDKGPQRPWFSPETAQSQKLKKPPILWLGCDCRAQSRDDSRAARWLLTARHEQSHGELLALVLEQQNCSRGFASCSETCSCSAVITSPCRILFDKHVIYDGIKKGMLLMLSLLSLSDDSVHFCRHLPALRGN